MFHLVPTGSLFGIRSATTGVHMLRVARLTQGEGFTW